jgi:hypothetical protein
MEPMMPQNFVVSVDGKAYGFFTTRAQASNWIETNFPVAAMQGNYEILELLPAD